MINENEKRVLGVQLATDPRWVNLAEKELEEILTDHAYCEQKATTTCISLIQRYPDKEFLVEKVAPVVSEEWSHFRMVVKELKKRGLRLGKQRKDEYVNELMKFQRKGVTESEVLLDKLMVCAMIEARSCERFRLLSKYVSDDSLKEFYHQFMISEAGHYKMFLEIARYYVDSDIVEKRWNDCLEFEANILKNIEIRADRMH